MLHNVFDAMQSNQICGEDNVFAQFLQTNGLYDSMEITEENISDLITLLDGQVRISVYCKECKTERVFAMEPIFFFLEDRGEYLPRKLSEEVNSLQKMLYKADSKHRQENGGEWQWKNWQINEDARVLIFKFICSMNPEHHLDYVVLTDNKMFKKIGQFPSVADLTFPELDVYKRVMSKDDRKEFGTAIGLYASGVGAGAYVYLRRILERLLMQAKAHAGNAIDEEKFNNARVGEKITMLSAYLPEALTSNPTLYGILSKGIHELTEAECLSYFPVVKECLYMILDQWEEMRKKEEKQRSISASLSKIASTLK